MTQAQSIPARYGQRGQGMTEYIVVVALIAVASIALYTYFGQTVRSQTSGMANEVAGVSAANDIATAQGAAANARSEGAKTKGLDAYNSK